MAKNPVCVRHSSSLEEAEVIAAWLDEQGVATHIVDRGNHALPGITDIKGVDIFVDDAASADKAKQLLADHDKGHEPRSNGGALSITCGECGAVNEFPPDAAGTVQQCNQCRAYVDTTPQGEAPTTP